MPSVLDKSTLSIVSFVLILLSSIDLKLPIKRSAKAGCPLV